MMMQGSGGGDLDLGPAPPPSLTLPPLSEIDKVIRPDSVSGAGAEHHRYPPSMTMMSSSQSRSQSQLSDPHLHSTIQHHQRPHYSSSHSSSSVVSSLPPQHPQQQQQQQHGSQYQHPTHHLDQHSRHSSSVGSLPDLYMSSSSAPSTTTTSSLSRADSLSTMEYLQGAHHHNHHHASGHSRRHLGDMSSISTGSTTGSSYGPSHSSGLSGSGSGSSASIVSGRSVHRHHHTPMGLGRANLTAALHHQQQQLQQQQNAMTASPSASSSSAHAQRSTITNGSKDTNGNGTTSTSGKSTGGSAGSEQGRNSTKRAAQNRAAQRAFRQRKDLYVRELEKKAELLQQAEDRIQALAARNHALEVALAATQQLRLNQHQSSSASSSSSPQPPPYDLHHRPQNYTSTSPTTEAPVRGTGMAREGDDEFEYDRLPRSTREHVPHHQQQSQDPSSPTRSSIRRQEPSQALRSSAYVPQGGDSDYHHDQGRRGSNNSADSGDDYGSRHKQSTNSGSVGLLPSDYSSDLQSSSTPPRFGSGNNVQQQMHERPPLYRISTEGGLVGGGLRSGALESANSSNPPSARSWTQHEDSTSGVLRSPRSSFSPLGGMVRGNSGLVGSPRTFSQAVPSDVEFMNEDRYEGRPPVAAALYDGIKKRQSEGNFNWNGSTSGRSTNHPGLSKQSSWSAFPSIKSTSSINNGSPSIQLPPLNSGNGSYNGHYRDSVSGDTEMQDSHNPTSGGGSNYCYQGGRNDSFPHPPQPQRSLQHRGSASSLSGPDAERRMSGSETGSVGLSRMAMSDSPDMSSSDSSRFGLHPSMRSQHQQPLQRPAYPHTPENEYPPTLHSPTDRYSSRGFTRSEDMNGSSEMEAAYDQYPSHPPHHHQQHQQRSSVKHHEPMETAMRSP
ncbi:hypothetical protein BGZ83_004939 [Gryganskiella cystojenkinii]|nr:hypothetical protein BGZ83_004939 [Gryganskiella cystojenkinii]